MIFDCYKAGCSAIEFILWFMFNFVAISLVSLFVLFIVISGAFCILAIRCLVVIKVPLKKMFPLQ